MTVLDRLSDAPPPSAALKELEDMVAPAAGAAAVVPGESAADREARFKEAASKATDLSGLVRHKKKEQTPTNGAKRKAEENEGGEEKKVKFDV
jgi:hypothetical protein